MSGSKKDVGASSTTRMSAGCSDESDTGVEETSPQITAFYPSFPYPAAVTTSGVHYVPGMAPFVPVTPSTNHSGMYGGTQPTGGLPYGMIIPAHSYDLSIALTAFAVGEARTLLQTNGHPLRDTKTTVQENSKTVSGTTPSESKKHMATKMAVKKSRSDVATWCREACVQIPCQTTHPRCENSLSFLERFKRARGGGYTLQNIVGYVALIALDQMGSRWLQRQLDESGCTGAKIIFCEVLENALLLSRDVFGNYIVQKMLQHGTQTEKNELGIAFKSRIRRLSFDVYGCRVVQKLVEETNTETAVALAKELEDAVLHCVQDTNASHVIQKCIERLPSDQIEPLIQPLCRNVKSIGLSSTGCRVIQRLIECCSLEDVRCRILNEIIDHITDLATSEYGNYVVQHVAHHGGPRHRTRAMRRIGTNFRLFSHHRYASRVVETFLMHVNDDEKQYMIESMFAIDGNRFVEEAWVLDMIRDPFANYIIQKILEVVQDGLKSMFLEVIRTHRKTLKEDGYGRSVVDAAAAVGLVVTTDRTPSPPNA